MAASGRSYVMEFNNVTISAVQDLFLLLPGSTKFLAIQGINLGAIATSTANARLRGRYLPSTVTNGSGGSAGTIKPFSPGDAAATATGRINDTTQATSSGTAVTLWSEMFNTVNGYLWVPKMVGRPPLIAPSGAFVLSLDTALSSLVCSGSIEFEEFV